MRTRISAEWIVAIVATSKADMKGGRELPKKNIHLLVFLDSNRPVQQQLGGWKRRKHELWDGQLYYIKIKWKFVEFRSKKLSTNWSNKCIGVGPNRLESELVQPAFCTEVNALEGCEELDFAASNLPKTPGGMWSRLVFTFFFSMEISGMMCLTCWEWLEQGIDVFFFTTPRTWRCRP